MAEDATINRLSASADTSTTAVSNLDISALFFRLLRNWWLLLIGLGLGYVVAKLYLRYQEVEYTVTATVQISNDETQNFRNVIGSGLASLSPGEGIWPTKFN